MTEQCYASGINPSAIPGDELDPDAVQAAARALARDGAAVRDAGADVLDDWRGLSLHYEAPEAPRLFSVMDPVETNARRFGDDVESVAAALTAYAEEIRPIKASLAAVRSDAWAFRGEIASNAEWEYDQDLVDRNTALVGRVNGLQVQLWEAERRCANAIRSLYGAPAWRAATSEGDARGYGVGEIPTDAAMPWGSEVQRKDHCPKSAAVGVKRFVWDGVVVDGLWGTVTGLGMLVGIDGTGWSWETMKTSWVGMGSLIGYAGGEWSWGNAGDAWTALGKGLIAYDTWDEDPARAAGGAVFNIATIFVPAGAAVSGTKTAGTAAGTAGRTATLLARGARVVDFVDPVALGLMGGRAALPKIGDMLADMRVVTQGLGDSLRVPDVPVVPAVRADLDVPVAVLDDAVTALDDLDGLGGDLPPVRDPDVAEPVRAEPATVPAPQPEPAFVGGSAADAPGGLGQGADSLHQPPTTSPSTTGGGAPAGGSVVTDPTPGAPSSGGATPGTTAPGGTGWPETPSSGGGGGTPTGTGWPGGASPGAGADDLLGGPGTTDTPDVPGGGTVADPVGGQPGDAPASDVPAREYGLADGSEHRVAFAPEQLDTSHTAARTIDAMLADPDLFARHGIEPWTRAELVEVVMTSVRDLSPAQIGALREIADALPPPTAGDVVQKVLTPEQVRLMLDPSTASTERALSLGGSITRVEDTAALTTVRQLQEGLRLDYDDVTFLPHDESVYLVRTRATGDHAVVSRFSEMGGTGATDAWHDPYTGNGFLKSDALIPEYRIENPVLMDSGTEMWEVLADGTQRLVAVIRDDAGWVRVS
ncbi:hypothetical protein [Actinotalea sp. Marseille-Q4924]|uniref:hypothetical protein n=1 Tax=Actinotalea sp. Marseille-Q4924 TaxID=2866571 RepID=UPI001CE45276|nr:hypothetical protein [Actinotalea sp. Marseille-Q4924]